VKREVLYNILTVFVVPIKLVRLITICLNETYMRDEMRDETFSLDERQLAAPS
jgi:hypothetical protein